MEKPETIFDFTKFFYLSDEKEKATSRFTKNVLTNFRDIPSIRFLRYQMPNDQSQLNIMGWTDISSATNSPLKEEISPVHLKQIKPTKKPTDTQSQEPLPKAIHQTQSIIAQTITKSQRHFKDQTIPKPLASSSYNNTYQKAHTKSHYVKKNISQQACSKIILRTTSEPLKATTDSRLQEEINH